MIIRYFAMLREVTHRSEQTWDQPVPTVGELLRTLCASYGPGFSKWVTDGNGNLGQFAIVLVNGVDCRELGGLGAPLASEDVIAIFPPVAGG